MRTWLLDTGPLVAYLDARDSEHGRIAAILEPFSGQLLTSSAVITEAMHFVSATRHGPRALAEFIHQSRTEVYDLSRPPELSEAVSLMERFADTPMDFADATLVLLAEALSTNEILTLDRRGFSAYRTRAGQALQLVLDLV